MPGEPSPNAHRISRAVVSGRVIVAFMADSFIS
jgi:hypothetical protein